MKKDLGAIPGLTDRSIAWGINSKPQIVGISISCDFSVVDAFLWENGGPMVDLNTLSAPESTLHLFQALSINERGDISGLGVLPSGDIHAFLLIPCGRGSLACRDAAASTVVKQRHSKLNAKQRRALRRMVVRSRVPM